MSRHPTIEAMWDRVDSLPDLGEGSSWHLCSQAAWEIEHDYNRAVRHDPSVLAEFTAEYDTFEKIAAACLRSAEKVAS